MLKSYPGLLILVSHDKRFRESTTSVSYNIQNQTLVNLLMPHRASCSDEMMVLENKIAGTQSIIGRIHSRTGSRI